MKELFKKVLMGFDLSQCKTRLTFYCTDKDYVYLTEPDCCNSVWFSDINPCCGYPALVLKVKQDDWTAQSNVKDEKFYNEVNEHSFFHIETTQGVFTVEVRNSHNGYYGGQVVYVGEDENDIYS